MKTLSILLLLTISQQNLFSQSAYQHWKWAKSFGGSGNDIPADMKIKNGFLYVTGTYESPQVNWDGTVLVNKGARDIFLAKMDTNGNTIWVKSFGGPGVDSVSQLEVNGSGTTLLKCTSSGASVSVGTATLTSPKDFYITVNSNGSIASMNVLPGYLTFQDIDIDMQGSVYVAERYLSPFSFAGTTTDSSYSKSGAAILKFDATGNPAWVRNLQNRATVPGPTSVPGNGEIELRMEFNNFDSSLIILGSYCGFTKIDDAQFLNPISLYCAKRAFYVKLAMSSSTKLIVDGFLPVGSLSTRAFDFEVGNSGLNYTTFYRAQLNDPYAAITAMYDNTRIKTATWINPGPSNMPISVGTLETSENGNFFLANINDTPSVFGGILNHNIQIADSNLNFIKKTNIPEIQQLSLLIKSMADTGSVYFSSPLTGSVLTLNTGIVSAPVITIQNQGVHNIMIGQYAISASIPISLNQTERTIKVCSNTFLPKLTVDAPDSGARLIYHWQPGNIFSDSTALNPKIFIPGDSVKATLTVTDINGNYMSTDFIFYKGIDRDIKLVVSDSLICKGSNINLSLKGTYFEPCSYNTIPFQEAGYFSSLADVSNTYFVNGNHSVYIYPLNSTSNSCFNSSVDIRTKPSYQTGFQIKLCAGSSYTFPDGTTTDNITSNVFHTSHLRTVLGCDSAIETNIQIVTQFIKTDSIALCSGSNYTFADGTTLQNISANTSHLSHLTTHTGCDSVITTNIVVGNPSSKTDSVTLCSGSSYRFPDGTEQSNILANTTQVNHLVGFAGCDSTIITIITIIPVDINVTKNGLHLQANSTTGAYQWIDCATNNQIAQETSQVYNASMEGSYAVEIANKGCIDTSACYTVTATDITNGRVGMVNVYPNPTQQNVSLTIQSSAAADLSASLYNSDGVLIKTNKYKLSIGTTSIAYSITNLSKGWYTLKLVKSDTHETIIKKIIKN